MVIEKKYLETLLKVLKDTNLSLADARIRDRFMKEAGTSYQQLMADREDILKKFCDKDEEENPIVTKNSEGIDTYHFSSEVQSQVNAELIILMDETIDIEPSNSETMGKIKAFAENTEYKPLVGEAEDIDAILSRIV